MTSGTSAANHRSIDLLKSCLFLGWLLSAACGHIQASTHAELGAQIEQITHRSHDGLVADDGIFDDGFEVSN